MNDAQVIELAGETMWIIARLAAPILLVALGVGLFISLMQSVTQIQEVTLTFVPKLIGVGLVLALAGNWMLNELVAFTQQMFDTIPSLL